MSLKHGILGLLNYGPTTGYDLDKIFKGSLNFFWQSQTSQIYRELRAMEGQGWISAEIVVQQDKPNKNIFTLTASGKEELQRWLMHDSIGDDIKVRDPFLVKLFFSGEINAEANIETMQRFKQCCQYALKKINETKKHVEDAYDGDKNSVYWEMTASFGHYYYEMCILWADECIMKLERLK
ncbi:MAG: PadR family transcriptional regulator [Clostridia bacterium]